MHKATLREAQILMKTILRDIDNICRENDISYWIESGTMVGAKRHNGFIPWDDDIDIGMMRKDYERFLELAPSYLPDDLFLQNAQLDNGVENSWSKVRHKYSKLIEEDDAEYHEGLFVDIFPYDFYECNLKDKSYIRKKISEINYLMLFKSKLTYEKNIVENLKRVIAKVYKQILIRKDLNQFCVDRQKKATNGIKKENGKFVGYGSEIGEFDFDRYMEKDIIFPIKEGNFEDIKVKIPNDSHRYLSTIYGERYMDIPKVEDRYNHNKGIYIYKTRK
ncbi:LicD family protein [Clostridium sp. D43t1_170807_H7]|uniref:LicD family protein n=1 Tax=Clostridium sp. D43t1_170807_H7 TaxID=2787140 RepID=UPI0018999466|nr:LicD family protein [Clostridium sp. D43t1_170807_H7]